MDRLTKATWALWPALAAEMGVDPAAFKRQPLAQRDDARVAMVALRVAGAEASFVLKRQIRPEDPAGFARGIDAQIAAAEAYPGAVPVMHAVDLKQQACVMEYVAGVPLAVALRDCDLAGQAALLRRAGAWLDGWHRATLGKPRVFQPRFTLGYLQRIMTEVTEGQRSVQRKTRFLACAETLLAQKSSFEGQQTHAAQTHGDLHMRNLLIGNAVWGIDFAGGDVVPVGHDIARLLSDYAILNAEPDTVPAGEVLPDAASAAFFEGYTLVGARDPSVRLLLRHRVLAEWWGLPTRGLSSAQERRWRGIERLVPRIFSDAF